MLESECPDDHNDCDPTILWPVVAEERADISQLVLSAATAARCVLKPMNAIAMQ